MARNHAATQARSQDGKFRYQGKPAVSALSGTGESTPVDDDDPSAPDNAEPEAERLEERLVSEMDTETLRAVVDWCELADRGPHVERGLEARRQIDMGHIRERVAEARKDHATRNGTWDPERDRAWRHQSDTQRMLEKWHKSPAARQRIETVLAERLEAERWAELEAERHEDRLREIDGHFESGYPWHPKPDAFDAPG